MAIHERRNLSQPPEYWLAWEQAAKKKGLTLSLWVAQQLNESLPIRVRKKLPERKPMGRPKTKGERS